jgi:hypothetical protein
MKTIAAFLVPAFNLLAACGGAPTESSASNDQALGASWTSMRTCDDGLGNSGSFVMDAQLPGGAQPGLYPIQIVLKSEPVITYFEQKNLVTRNDPYAHGEAILKSSFWYGWRQYFDVDFKGQTTNGLVVDTTRDGSSLTLHFHDTGTQCPSFCSEDPGNESCVGCQNVGAGEWANWTFRNCR